MQKKYIVKLTPDERAELVETVRKLKGTSQKVKRAQILLKADLNGPGWTDKQISAAFDCRVQTVEEVRRRLVEQGFSETLNGARNSNSIPPKVLDGKHEAQVIAMRLGEPPKGYSNWSLRLLARKVVELGLVDSICHETVRRTLKKTA